MISWMFRLLTQAVNGEARSVVVDGRTGLV